MNVLYCDCFSGISGDMFLAAMVDAGLPIETLSSELKKLSLKEFKDVHIRKVMKGALQASQLFFELNTHAEVVEGNSYDIQHPETDIMPAVQDYYAADEAPHNHLSKHNFHHNHGAERHFTEISNIIQSSGLSDSVKKISSDIFLHLAKAEAKVHGIAIEEVAFHEVGAVDSILDIVGAAISIDYFNIDKVYSSALPLGSGMVQTQHGLLPLPAPATLELLNAAGAQVLPASIKNELVTPTGAAILSTLAVFEQPPMKITHLGLGAGHMDLPWPNILRLIFGESSTSADLHIELETNIDDMNPQFYASVMEHLFANGALDVYITPIQMKKNRPAIKLSVIADTKNEQKLAQMILRETSTLGVRIKDLRRYEADREIRKVSTQYGEIRVKTKILDGNTIQANPEYDDCLSLAEKRNIPVAVVYREAQMAALALIQNCNP